MNNFSPDDTDARGLQRNQQSLMRHLDDSYYRRSFTPGQLVLSGTSAFGTAGQSAGLPKWPTVDFPDAAVSYAVGSFSRPALWVDGQIKITVYYTSTTAGTANFTLLLAMYTVKQPGNLSNTGVTPLSPPPTNLVPGPAAIDDELVFETYTTVAINAAARRIGFRVGRDGADANNNVLQVTEIVLEHFPARAEVS